MPRHYNLIGTLAWIATRDEELSDAYNALWGKAKNKDEDKQQLARVVVAIQLGEDIPQQRLVEADATLCDACVEAKIQALGWKQGARDIAAVPVGAWIDAEIDVVSGSIKYDGHPIWSGIRFPTVDVRRLWDAAQVEKSPIPKKPTGPPRKYLSEVSSFLRRHQLEVSKAIEQGSYPPPPPTGDAIAKALSTKTREVSARTIRDTLKWIRNGKDWGTEASPF